MIHGQSIGTPLASAVRLPPAAAVLAAAPLGAEAVHSGSTADPPPWPETSTEIMHARYFSPILGRFVSVDPVGGEVGSSQSWNRYSYVLNNPLGLVDPRGFECDPSGWGPCDEEPPLELLQSVMASAERHNQSIDATLATIDAAGAGFTPYTSETGSVISVGIAGEISPPGVFGAGGFDLNIGVDLVYLELTGFSLTAEIGAGPSTGEGGSLSVHGRLWPSVESVLDLDGTGHSVGGALAGGVGGSFDLLLNQSLRPIGGQLSVEAGGRFSPITGVDLVGGRAETRTVVGYDRDQGWRFLWD